MRHDQHKDKLKAIHRELISNLSPVHQHSWLRGSPTCMLHVSREEEEMRNNLCTYRALRAWQANSFKSRKTEVDHGQLKCENNLYVLGIVEGYNAKEERVAAA